MPKPAQKFSEFIAQHRNGLADAELSEVLEEVVHAVNHSTRKKATGSITLKIKLTSEGDMIAITDVSSSTTPDETEARAYFIGLDGELTRKNPLQPSLTQPTGQPADGFSD